MLCDNCHERPAAIHLTQIEGNEVTTAHLCEQCAAEKGIQAGATVTKLPAPGFVASVGQGAAAALPPDADAGSCPQCGATLQDFRNTGRLGCAQCYSTFEQHLRELLRRIHGAPHHKGKLYLAATPLATADPEGQIEILREQLRRAVDAENFEAAAELRDRIKALE
ncbi:MAG: UvrB/UvrC motif-containing protein [Gemmatimonadales bacterium]|jgi:protein arginine kinase activator